MINIMTDKSPTGPSSTCNVKRRSSFMQDGYLFLASTSEGQSTLIQNHAVQSQCGADTQVRCHSLVLVLVLFEHFMP